MSDPATAAAPTPFSGVIPPMITPLKAEDELDVSGLERLIEHILAGGVSGLFVLGTTGEAPSLSHRLRRELVERVCRRTAGRVPVLVGITDTSIVEALEMAAFSADSGAAAVVLAPPYYYPNSQLELCEYVGQLAPRLPLPLFLYNMPSHTKTIFEIDSLRRMAEIPNIAGIKDSSSSMVYFHQLLRLLELRPEWSVLMGPEELLGESVLMGGHGGVCGGANICPRLYTDLYEAARARNVAQVLHLHRLVMDISCSLYRIGGLIQAIKCSLNLLGICDDYQPAPFHRFCESERKAVRVCLDRLGISAAGANPSR